MDESKKVVRVLTVSYPTRVTVEDIDDIMVSALEGGINYWCDCAEVIEEKRVADWGNEQIARGGMLRMHVIEPYDGKGTEWYELTLQKFLFGLRTWLEFNPDVLEFKGNMYCIDCGKVDAIRADHIVQNALFGEVVYG